MVKKVKPKTSNLKFPKSMTGIQGLDVITKTALLFCWATPGAGRQLWPWNFL
jgi:hypothetical protein